MNIDKDCTDAVVIALRICTVSCLNKYRIPRCEHSLKNGFDVEAVLIYWRSESENLRYVGAVLGRVKLS